MMESPCSPEPKELPALRLLSMQREETKEYIYTRRRLLGKYHCPVCEWPIDTCNNPGEMHEVLLTRGDVQGAPPDVQRMIHVPENCVLVHPGHCHRQAQHAEQGKTNCMRQLVQFEGYDRLQDWLKMMERYLKGPKVKEMRRLLKEYRPVLEATPGIYGEAERVMRTWQKMLKDC